MIRSNRLYGPNDDFRTATTFTAAFGAVSRSRISRWETGHERLRFETIRRYEDLLELPPHRLVTVADLVYRQQTSVAGAPVLGRTKGSIAQTEELLDRVFSEDVMTGHDWDVLSANLLALGHPLLYPRSRWADLAERLIGELIISDGLGWLGRNEAARRLLGLPAAVDAMVAGCRSLVADPSCQIVIEPLGLLDSANQQTANRFVLRQLHQPENERVLRGALLACIAKTRQRHFVPSELQELVGTVRGLLADPDLATDARVLGAEILRTGVGGRALGAVADPLTVAVLRFGETAPPAQSTTVVGRVVDHAVAHVPHGPAPTPDPVLTKLVEELLFSANSDVRLTAVQVLAATPFREPVGKALLAELRTNGGGVRSAILSALPQLEMADGGTFIRQQLLGPHSELTGTAAWTIGHLPGDPGSMFWSRALRRHATSTSTAQGLVYGMGVKGQDELLRAVSADQTLPWHIRRSAFWWLGLPSHIRTSAGRL